MDTPVTTIAAVVALASLYVLLPVLLHTFQLYRHKRVVTCPENRNLAEVNVDVQLAVFSSAFGEPQLRVRDCSVWPRNSGCGQNCLKD